MYRDPESHLVMYGRTRAARARARRGCRWRPRARPRIAALSRSRWKSAMHK